MSVQIAIPNWQAHDKVVSVQEVRICGLGMPCINGEASEVVGSGGEMELSKLSVADAHGYFGLFFRNWNRNPGDLTKARLEGRGSESSSSRRA